MPRRQRKTEETGGVHGLWRGTLSFGLVSVPVAMFPALRRRPVHLRLLAGDGTPLRREYVCPKEGKRLEPEDLIRGYPLEDRYVVVEDRELEALAPEKGKDISLVQFVDAGSIDSFHYDRPYFLAPAGGSMKAYRLLAHVMAERKRAGIATFVMSGKERLVAILSENGLLVAQTLRFPEELRSPKEADLTERLPADPDLVKAYAKAAEGLAHARIDEKELEDRYARRFLRLVERKKRDRAAVVHAAVEEDAGDAEAPVDLIAIFKERMARAKAG